MSEGGLGPPPAAGASPPGRVQLRLIRYYGLEQQPDIDAFVASEVCGRECVRVHENDGVLALRVHLPAKALQGAGPRDVDTLCQLVEGVSHFVLLAERARRELPTTQLELELQAEIDKFLLLSDVDRGGRATHEVARLRALLFEQVCYVFSHADERGRRYRLANRLAGHFTGHLQRTYLKNARLRELRSLLRRFYTVSPSDKVAWARAA